MKKYYFLGVGTILFVGAFYFLVMVVIGKQSLSVDTSVWGAFGSYFGGISGPILSFLAFVILAKTLIIQQSMSSSQEEQQVRQRQFSELELCYKNLERLEVQFDEMINKRAGKLRGKTIRDVLDTVEDKIDKNDPNVKEAASSIIISLVFISYYVADIENRLKEYYPDDSEFSTLSFKQYWILKYRPLTKNCLLIIPDTTLTKQQRQCLLDGLAV
ncbi:hypothetical protein [Photobacterium sanguinicancri]|uniref:DUF4760 domain-containing protein n=1 Tax=Photobacterium sanguinicancri TaxID=875932 RepID=A0AAW7YCP5_9GAMM|nr:hypothetical protein [Photobacterium sanguinicancri]MDO6545516.1 hypothetical protein [Photobacterium sanguinicancri]